MKVPFLEVLPNGLTVIVESMPHVASIGYELHLPGGLIFDPEHRQGLSLIAAEMCSRGVRELPNGLGDRLDAHALADRFDQIGARHSEEASSDKIVLRGLSLPDELPSAMLLTAQMARTPSFPADETEATKDLLLQELHSLKENPAQWAFQELAQRYFPPPYNRSPLGEEQGLTAASTDEVVSQYNLLISPRGSILSIAGNISPEEGLALATRLYGDWEGSSRPDPIFSQVHTGLYHHVPWESAQCQIAMAYPGPKVGDSEYYSVKIAHALLSGGMHGRLFVEVREKRGLCYSVHSKHSADRQAGTCVVYAGTTPERVEETFEIVQGELQRVAQDLSAEELQRAKTTILSALILGEESSSARAGSNASDLWTHGKVRTREEIRSGVSAVTPTDLQKLLERFPPHTASAVTLGPRGIAARGWPGAGGVDKDASERRLRHA